MRLTIWTTLFLMTIAQVASGQTSKNRVLGNYQTLAMAPHFYASVPTRPGFLTPAPQVCSLRYRRSTPNTSASAMCFQLGIDRIRRNLELIKKQVGACFELLAQVAAT